jgi:hypothetical protein
MPLRRQSIRPKRAGSNSSNNSRHYRRDWLPLCSGAPADVFRTEPLYMNYFFPSGASLGENTSILIRKISEPDAARSIYCNRGDKNPAFSFIAFRYRISSAAIQRVASSLGFGSYRDFSSWN